MPVRSVLKRTPVQDINYFSIRFYYIISTIYIKKLETYFALLYFWTFAQCVQPYFGLIKISSKQILCATPHTSQDVLSFLHAFSFFPPAFLQIYPLFAISTKTTFHTLFIQRRQKWQKRNSVMEFHNGLIYFLQKTFLFICTPWPPPPLVVFFYRVLEIKLCGLKF